MVYLGQSCFMLNTSSSLSFIFLPICDFFCYGYKPTWERDLTCSHFSPTELFVCKDSCPSELQYTDNGQIVNVLFYHTSCLGDPVSNSVILNPL
ncbi:hypothetical protein XELAEV_18036587mg [Xenopus laevis]|uniref:Uncharacterized protein n=1 Tax=Xenopus laevis TaxID=8355 RepID=A0A974HD68_XENLA|nr:hypothetical protein XELAEV_18036587mg [Xenopus laevis]